MSLIPLVSFVVHGLKNMIKKPANIAYFFVFMLLCFLPKQVISGRKQCWMQHYFDVSIMSLRNWVKKKKKEKRSGTNNNRKAVWQRTVLQETTILKSRILQKTSKYGWDTAKGNVTQQNIIMKNLTGTIYQVTKKIES